MNTNRYQRIRYLCTQIPEMLEHGFTCEAKKLCGTLYQEMAALQEPLLFENESSCYDVSGLAARWKFDDLPKHKVAMIKELRALTGCGLAEAKNFIEKQVAEYLRKRDHENELN